MSKSNRKNDEILNSMLKLICSAVVLGLLWFTVKGYLNWLDNSSLFTIKSMKISGSNYLSDKEILRLGGLDSAKKIWDADLENAVKSIKTYPFIEDAYVVRKIPDKIIIKIVEKLPIALLNFKGDLYAIDRQGLILPSIPGKMYNLPVISGDFLGGLKTGTRISGGVAKKGLSVIESIIFNRPSIYSDISEVVVKKNGQVILFTRRDGIPVKMGKEAFLNKIASLDAILIELKKERTLSKVNYIDLRFRGQVIVGMRT